MSDHGPDLKAMNQAMVERISQAPAEPIPDDGYGLRVLEVAGRHSGRPTRTPIGLLSTRGAEYLVCPDRTRDWPQNVRAAGWARIVGGGEQTEVRASEVGGSAAAEVVAAYLRAVTVPWAVAAFRVRAGAGAGEIEPQLDRMAVFRLEPIAADSGPADSRATGTDG